jgi:hypothetical protein
MFAGIPDFHAEIRRSVQDGDTTWIEWRWSGTRSDGQAFEMRGVTLFETVDGQIDVGRLYMEAVERDVIAIEQAVQALSGRRQGGPAGPSLRDRAAPDPVTRRPVARGSAPARKRRGAVRG